MTEHVCTVCFRTADAHDGRCEVGEPPERGAMHYHLLPLCCPGCGCGLYELAHPVEAVR